MKSSNLNLKKTQIRRQIRSIHFFTASFFYNFFYKVTTKIVMKQTRIFKISGTNQYPSRSNMKIKNLVSNLKQQRNNTNQILQTLVNIISTRKKNQIQSEKIIQIQHLMLQQQILIIKYQ
ncbi:transmembrane protein, putative (macronuclear) [Tetrahymena thermophila SB210]|uniref:Transmembrane protein, putative n=1 Tax=Tetrahymena thermophila (strain SB210) TaxID=312017 RepID=W7XFE6_TETTS|nr:transmembrane protein, putative [Tetrahymena thermophila SB210]EWS71509.1 transmembrane protein, putative [Tetrahymena thermophila SB210]|eukprot:XP_012655954.1 transmembrane protein, putative [Tetrahymena thermophila SB210]